MKKIFTLTLFGLFLVSANAQVSKLVIQDTAILKLFKNIANGDYNGYPGAGTTNTSCPTCFSGDTLITADFKNYTNILYNIHKLGGIIDLHKQSIFDLEPFRYLNNGPDKNTYYDFGANKGVSFYKFILDSNFITDASPLYDLMYGGGGYPTEIYLQNNYITDVKINMYGSANYPDKAMLDFSNNLISRVEIQSSLTINTINLSGNYIDSFFGYSGHNIDLKFNHSKSLYANFSGQGPASGVHYVDGRFSDSLKSLYIDVGNNEGIGINFSYCSNLTNVSTSYTSFYTPNFYFSHCNISTMKLQGGTNPSSYDLSYNNLSTVSPNAGLKLDIVGGKVGKLNLSHNKISSFSFLHYPFQPYTISQVYESITWLDLSNNNLSNIVGDLSNLLTYLKVDSNNLHCLPVLPVSLTKLYFDTTKINCLPNVGSFTINGTSNNVYATCTPTNNANHCSVMPTVTGKIYLDSNKNNIKDANEKWLPFIEINLRTANGKTFKTYTNINGEYAISGDTVGDFVVKATPSQNFIVKPDSIKGIFIVYDSLHILGNIAMQPTTNQSTANDMVVFSAKTLRSHPGFPFAVTTFAKNIGTATLQPTISLWFDSSKIDYLSNACGGSLHNGNTIEMAFANFANGLQINCRSMMKLKTTAQINDTLWFYTTTTYNTTATGTVTLKDSFYSVVTGSYDPNDKTGTSQLTTTQVANGDYIDYTVHFQNTGNDTAFTVVIADTLSSLLQANTLQVVGSSHNCKTTINGNKVYFEFTNILLPDSNVNQAGSNGFIRFRIKPIPTLVAGTTICNKASIYFDYNTAVVTNCANTTIVTPTIIVPLRFTDFRLQLKDKKINNIWMTANESNVSHYNIQRSANGKDFTTIGQVKANNKSSNEYSFDDQLTSNEKQGTLYYRIVGIDKDGSITNSEIKTINFKPQTQNIALYPNPSKNEITISRTTAATEKVEVFTVLGKKIITLQLNSVNQSIDISNWQKGVYILSFENGEKMKLVKE